MGPTIVPDVVAGFTPRYRLTQSLDLSIRIRKERNSIVTAQDGFPFTPLVGSNISGTGDASQSDVPNWNPDFKGPVILRRPDQWFDPRAFQMPTAGTFGNVSRGSLRGPGLVNFDTSLFKKFAISERWNLQFRAEAFNVFNHTDFSHPNQIVFSGNAISLAGTR